MADPGQPPTPLIQFQYPRRLFHFATGVLRWTWRVAYYSYGALATDRYPPFSLGAESGYPARLYIRYPGRLPRGAALLKWWLRATPQYLLIVLSLGSFQVLWWIGGFLPVLALAALVAMVFTSPGVVLLCTGRYPKRQFDTLVGFDRWLIRVLAYAFLLTDEYPPLRMDRGGTEPDPPAPAGA
ncbi:DUF4389 domain-containing protein [Kitasatospora sp. NPDC056531]|uniref:DUF4389 domain-containing protein n=1 Tax=Kitasatospora sp. NPDC056531 TaxID=3345856 RepID=UPI0036B5AD52